MCYLGEVVAGVAVEDHAADLGQRVISVRPDLGHIEGIELTVLGLSECHALVVDRPRGGFASSDGVVEVSDGIIGVGRRDAISLGGIEILDALIRLEVPFHIHSFSVIVHTFECVRAVAIHMAVSIGSSSVGKQDAHLMNGLWTQRKKIPHGIWILAMSGWIALLGMNEGRKQDGISDEKDGRVVPYQIPIAFFCIEFDSKTTWITGSVC